MAMRRIAIDMLDLPAERIAEHRARAKTFSIRSHHGPAGVDRPP
jgi:hypothetical protein